MPKLEYNGIIARPGTYRRKNGTTIIKTWEELKKAFSRTHELKLTLGHPITPDKQPRPANVRDFLGRVLPIINEKKQVIEGLFQFYTEPWESIPEHIRNMIVNDQPIEISVGYTSETDTQGVQTGMLHDHVALLTDGENPICPLDQCGINVRLESDDGGHNMTYEEATSTKDEPEEPAKEKEPVTDEQVTGLVSFTQEQFDRLISTIKPQEQPAVEAEAKPLEGESDDLQEKSEPQVEEPVPEPPPEPSLEPERAFPAGKPSKGKSPYLKEDGSVEVPSDIYLGGTKRKQ